MKRFLAAALLVALLLTCAGCQSTDTSDIGFLTIHYLDVGHADCMLLIAGETTILIDGGNTDTSHEVLSYLQRYGVEELDLVVNTHPHGDHLGGLPTVLENIPVETLWCSTTEYDTYLFSRFQSAAAKQGLQIRHPEPGTVYQEDALTLTVLGPLEDSEEYVDLNDTSLVLMVEFGERKFLFTGDMEAYAEKQLVDAGVDLNADVLKVGHHGSYSSTSQIFLDAVDPEYGIISCALGNEYGHPHDAPMHRLERANVTLLRTDLMGNIVLVTDGSTLAFFLDSRNTALTGYAKAA